MLERGYARLVGSQWEGEPEVTLMLAPIYGEGVDRDAAYLLYLNRLNEAKALLANKRRGSRAPLYDQCELLARQHMANGMSKRAALKQAGVELGLNDSQVEAVGRRLRKR